MKSLTAPIAVFCIALLAGAAVVFIPATKDTSAPMIDPHTDLIVVEYPKPGESVDTSKPVVISGKARGQWYFEASFPLSIQNASGATLAEGYGQAEGEWMTTEFVPFTATLNLPAQPTGSTGSIVLKKDNPSGDAERDDSIIIPVVFK